MPCCWPATETAATPTRPPASARACFSACHQSAGSTSVPGGCAARPSRTSAPPSASRTTTLHDWVDESIPATSVFIARAASARSPAGRAVRTRNRAPRRRRRRSPRRPCGRPAARRRSRRRQRRRAEFRHPARGLGLDHLRVGTERGRALLQQQVHAHVRRRRGPHARLVLRPRRLVVEVTRPVVGRPTTGPAELEQVDEREGVVQVAVTEDQVLIELDATLTVQIDMEQLAVPQGLGDAVGEVQAGHLLVADLRVHTDHLVVLQALDEGQRVPDGRQQDVAARLVRLRLQREPDAVVLVLHVASQQVDRLAVAVERGPHVLALSYSRPRARPTSRTSARPVPRPGRCCASPYAGRSGAPPDRCS